MRAAGKFPRLLAIGLFCLGPFNGPAGAGEPQTPAAQIAHLRADLTGPESATQVLTRWCGDLGLASPPVIKAVRVPGANRKPGANLRALLRADAGQPVRYRKVRLMCGGHVLSEADNWYLPNRLTADMNRTLDHTDTSFGTVVQPLAFHRQTLVVVDDTGPRFVLHVRALLVSSAGLPFSLVVENYRRVLLSR